jgi:hypothetical protein
MVAETLIGASCAILRRMADHPSERAEAARVLLRTWLAEDATLPETTLPRMTDDTVAATRDALTAVMQSMCDCENPDEANAQWPDANAHLDALIAAVRAEQHGSPILAFQAWVEQRVAATGRPLTQDEYFLAQAAFYAAHPGDGPHSTFQLSQAWVTKVTNAPE